ncbi:hypothetical protein SOPP22_06795 [Shewanella sp. OPT22]|nr:hypothetical protein SOPP22_06795 [Shewanella sp. OPT22]
MKFTLNSILLCSLTVASSAYASEVSTQYFQYGKTGKSQAMNLAKEQVFQGSMLRVCGDQQARFDCRVFTKGNRISYQPKNATRVDTFADDSKFCRFTESQFSGEVACSTELSAAVHSDTQSIALKRDWIMRVCDQPQTSDVGAGQCAVFDQHVFDVSQLSFAPAWVELLEKADNSYCVFSDEQATGLSACHQYDSPNSTEQWFDNGRYSIAFLADSIADMCGSNGCDNFTTSNRIQFFNSADIDLQDVRGLGVSYARHKIEPAPYHFYLAMREWESRKNWTKAHGTNPLIKEMKDRVHQHYSGTNAKKYGGYCNEFIVDHMLDSGLTDLPVRYSGSQVTVPLGRNWAEWAQDASEQPQAGDVVALVRNTGANLNTGSKGTYHTSLFWYADQHSAWLLGGNQAGWVQPAPYCHRCSTTFVRRTTQTTTVAKEDQKGAYYHGWGNQHLLVEGAYEIQQVDYSDANLFKESGGFEYERLRVSESERRLRPLYRLVPQGTPLHEAAAADAEVYYFQLHPLRQHRELRAFVLGQSDNPVTIIL